MSRWPRGEDRIEQPIATKQLQRAIGGQANGVSPSSDWDREPIA